MSGADCIFHQKVTHTQIPNKPTSAGAANITTWLAQDTQEPTSVDLPNPNLRTLQNSLGDHGAYPVYVPTQRAASKALPSPDLYQRATRRPWDISTVQFSKMVNKRASATLLWLAGLTFVVMPAVPKIDPSVDTGRRPGFGLGVNTGFKAPGPKPDYSFSGN